MKHYLITAGMMLLCLSLGWFACGFFIYKDIIGNMGAAIDIPDVKHNEIHQTK